MNTYAPQTFHKIQKEGIVVLNSFYKVSITLKSKERKAASKRRKIIVQFP
jgi:hypothetical protein